MPAESIELRRMDRKNDTPVPPAVEAKLAHDENAAMEWWAWGSAAYVVFKRVQ